MAGSTVYLTNRVPIPSSSYQGQTVYLSDGVGQGAYLIRWLDRYGAVVASSTGDAGQSFSAPAVPTVSGLTNGRWSEAATLVTRDMDILPLYDTADGKGHVFIQASALLGLTAAVKVTKTDGSTLLIEWGDGTTDSSTATGAVTVTHLYAAGSFEAKFSISVGTGDFSMGHGTTGNPFFAGVAVTELWMRSTSTSIPAYSLNGTAFRTMAAIVGANGVTSVGDVAVQNAYGLNLVALPNATTIAISAFQNNYAIMSAYLPNVASIGNNAFQACVSLVLAHFPLATNLSTDSFQGCSYLKTAIFPALVTVGSNVFGACFRLVYFSAKLLASVGNGMLVSSTSLSYLDIPKATSLGTTSLQSSFSLKGASFPLLTSINTNGMQGCVCMEELDLPSVITLGATSLQNCRNIESIRIGPNCTSVGNLALDSLRNLRALRIEALVPPALASVATLADYDPRLVIEVPAASLAAYQAATNWSSFSARMVGY